MWPPVREQLSMSECAHVVGELSQLRTGELLQVGR